MSPTAAVNFKQIAAIACGLALGCVFVLYSMCTMRVDKYSHYYLQTKKNVSRGSTEIKMEDGLKHESQVVNKSTRKGGENKVKKILFWNKWYHRTYYDFGAGEEPFKRYNCPEKRCSTTSNRDEFEEADAVVTCGRLMEWEAELVLPPRRDPEQVYVYFNREAPVTQLGNNHRLNNVFNVTMTYRRDSTIPFPYSVIEPRKDKLGYIAVTKEDIERKSKDHPVSWMVSRCHKKGCVRHEYVEHLSRFIPVDIYGRCGNLTCSRDSSDTCMIMQERRYKFYLAFENAVCRDYVTEKAFRTLNYSIVPVVMGGANYSEILPPHSFIDVRDFESPAQMASYLHYLNNNDTAYLEYFAWKRDYEVRKVEPYEVFCRLCQLLHEESQLLIDFDLEEWWDTMAGETCLLDDYRTKLMSYFNIDPSIEPVPKTNGKLLHLRSRYSKDETESLEISR
ncbi:hypothetical protein LSH36_646g01058 [Paralvinella palmiformis]|uniref:Fucosyltransferase n=1 Tax=Paralvinella palmiformis TaxID=53620 RepID=A0AAD9MW10_9ANNE|nr:hypothetical protein LSH36_646g01058 [Paralvinella palmiformis]